MSKISASASFSKILNTLTGLSVMNPGEARAKHKAFPNFAFHLSKLFQEDRLFDILPRLELQMQLIDQHQPPIRPALDPHSSTQLGIFSRNFSDWEVGHFLSYPECCIKPFAEEARFGLDERHAKEFKGMTRKIFATTAGFIPHSVHCEKSLDGALIGFVSAAELETMKRLEAETFRVLPHMHSEYRAQYYEIRAL
jgi:hypothetical protein